MLHCIAGGLAIKNLFSTSFYAELFCKFELPGILPFKTSDGNAFPDQFYEIKVGGKPTKNKQKQTQNPKANKFPGSGNLIVALLQRTL